MKEPTDLESAINDLGATLAELENHTPTLRHSGKSLATRAREQLRLVRSLIPKSE